LRRTGASQGLSDAFIKSALEAAFSCRRCHPTLGECHVLNVWKENPPL
jgi:hypothetical protein